MIEIYYLWTFVDIERGHNIDFYCGQASTHRQNVFVDVFLLRAKLAVLLQPEHVLCQ
jgi:hypothetical protein